MPFEARDLPTAVMFADGEVVAGPFCRHCGYPLSMHSDELLCPVAPNAIMGPICDCHEVREVEVTEWEVNHNTVRRTKSGRRYRRRVTHKRQRIVRVRNNTTGVRG